MILHLYFAKRFLGSFALIFAVFFSLVMLVDLVDQSRRFSDQSLGFQKLLGLSFLNAPETISQILPLMMILATVILFTRLARTSELVAARAAGRSGLTILLAPIAMALLIGVLAVAILNPIVAGTTKTYGQKIETYSTGGRAALSISAEGLWLRQGNSGGGQTVIRAWRSNEDASILYDVTFVEYSADQGPIRRIEAQSAALQDGAWHLTGAKIWPLEIGANAETSAQTHDKYDLGSSLTLDRIRDGFSKPNAVSIWNLPEFISQLETAGFSTRQHRVWLQMELARPLFLIAMVLVASAFTMRHTRLGGTGMAVLIAILLGFGLYFIRSFALILGENGQISVGLAAWAAPIASVLLALGLVLHMEEG
jgi:lipopolysaccharide export system permease protein